MSFPEMRNVILVFLLMYSSEVYVLIQLLDALECETLKVAPCKRAFKSEDLKALLVQIFTRYLLPPHRHQQECSGNGSPFRITTPVFTVK